MTALGVVIAVGILGSWWLGSLPEENVPDIGRVVFGNIPGLVVAAFYVVVASAAFVSVLLFADRARNWQRGAADDRTRMLKRRLHELRRGLSMRTLLRDPVAGLMHTAIYVGFLVLFAGTVTLEIDHILPVDLKFLKEASTRDTRSSSTCSPWCSSAASPGRRSAGTAPARGGSGRRPGQRTASSF